MTPMRVRPTDPCRAQTRPYGLTRGGFSKGQMRWLFAFARLTPETLCDRYHEMGAIIEQPGYELRRRSNTSSGLLGPTSC